MRDYGKMPWTKVQEYHLRVSSCINRSDFLHAASVEIFAIIPFDASDGIYSALDGRFLQGTGQSESVAKSYNAYYRKRRPHSLPAMGQNDSSPELSSHICDWREFGDSEFAVDFMLHHGMCKSLFGHILPQHEISLAIHRSRSSPAFSDWEINTLGLINEHLNNLYSRFGGSMEVLDPTLSAQQIAEKFSSLSSREVEVCSLVARRLLTSEIAASLSISRRTVEKHLESIFDKLDVQSREQLRWRLGVTPPAASFPAPAFHEDPAACPPPPR